MGTTVLAFLCLASAGVLSFSIDKELNQNREVFGLEHSLDRVLGSAKEVLGDELFLKADSYYHGGVKEKFHEKESDHEKSGFIEEDRELEPAHKAKISKDWIEKINDQVTAHQHYHLEGDKIKEMLPFFSLATTLNPHNVEAILTTSYWLEKHFQNPEAAITLLEKATVDNPESWEAEKQLADFYFRLRKDYVQSQAHYRAALKKSEDKKAEEYERFDMNYFLAESLYRLGRKQEALPFYQKALSYFGQRNSAALKEILQEKIAELAPVL